MTLQDGNAWNLSDIDTAADSVARARTLLESAGLLSDSLKQKLDALLVEIEFTREDAACANKGGN